MSAYDTAMIILASCGGITAIAALVVAARLDRLERRIAERKAAQHAAE